MHLIYIDESGQTGNNLRDLNQPIFVLGALIVPEMVWLAVEKDLQAAIEKHFPSPRPDGFEIHATEISNPRKSYFRQFPIAQRLAFRDEWFRLAQKYSLKLFIEPSSKSDFWNGVRLHLVLVFRSIRTLPLFLWWHGSWMNCSNRFSAHHWGFSFQMKIMKLWVT